MSASTTMVTSTPSQPDPTGPAAGARPRRLRPESTGVSVVATAVLLLLIGTFLEIGSTAQWWSPSILPAPSTMGAGMLELIGQQQFWNDAARTGIEVAVSIVVGSVAGLGIGLLFWKLPTVGRVFEPYMVSFYAVPMVLFYPVMIVLVGINATSVIILATIMAMIPMALNTTVGLAGMPAVYIKLAHSLKVSPRQLLFSIALPAAGPFIVAGLRLAVVYALIGCIAMEFVTAQAGLGYRIRYLYEIFDDNAMYSYILVVLVISVLLTALLALMERLILRGRRA
ncbi:MAG: ABC transporter permease [Propionibacteriaceae bacterium]